MRAAAWKKPTLTFGPTGCACPLRPQDMALYQAASALYSAFASYGSQRALQRMGRVVNGDKAFWPRCTDSLLYTARPHSPKHRWPWAADRFKLADSAHVAQREHRPL